MQLEGFQNHLSEYGKWILCFTCLSRWRNQTNHGHWLFPELHVGETIQKGNDFILNTATNSNVKTLFYLRAEKALLQLSSGLFLNRAKTAERLVQEFKDDYFKS